MAEGASVGEDAIRLDRIGAIGRVTLEPGLVRAAGWRAWTAAYEQWVTDPNVYGALIKFPRSAMLRSQDATTPLDEVADLYRLIWAIDRFSKPTVALLDGTTSWADFCLVRHGTHKVAGESFVLDLGLPSSGRFDAGATWWLARVSPSVAEPRALLGRRIGPAEALALGLVTHHVTAAAFAAIEQAYADADPIDQVLDGLPPLSSVTPGLHGGANGSFAEVEALIGEARTLSLKQTLERDYAILLACAEGASAGDWPGALKRAEAALALKPPAGVPEALG